MYVYVFNVCFQFVMTQAIRVLGCIRMEPILHAGACLWHAGACVDTLNPSFCKSSMYVLDFHDASSHSPCMFSIFDGSGHSPCMFCILMTQVIIIVSKKLRKHTCMFRIF